MKRFLLVLALLLGVISQAHSAVLVFSPGGEFVRKTTLAAAVAAADTAGKTIVVTSAETLAANLTIPSTRSLEIRYGGSINQGTYTVAINGPFNAGLSHVFTGTGAVTFGSGSVQEVFPQWWGGKGDGTTNNAAAFNSAIYSVKDTEGTVSVPATSSTYDVATTITLYPKVKIVGKGVQTPTIRLTGGATTLFNFEGTSEAQVLDVTFEYLTLSSSTATTGVAIRVRNFMNLWIKNVTVYNFNQGVWADWGIGVYIENSVLTTNLRAVQLGGGTGGIRVGNANPFMDQIAITNSGFSQNQIDINDMGSTESLGVIKVEGCSFYEGTAVASKTTFIRIAGREGINIAANWFENQQAGRVNILLNTFDYDAVSRGTPGGASITNNVFLVVGGAGSTGVQIDRGWGCYIGENSFVWQNSAGGYAINLPDTTSPATVGNNAFNTRFGGSYTSKVNYASDFHLILDPSSLSRTISTPNFITLPGGIKMQYAAISLNGGATNTWTFPKAFTAGAFAAGCTPLWTGNNLYTSLESLSTTAAVFRNSDNAGHAITAYCFAIGY